MADVKITTDLQLDDATVRVLRDLFGCTEGELGAKLGPYVKAAAHEYIEMFTGAAPITSATDVCERRLVAIIRHGLGAIPKPAELGRLFKMTTTGAATLVQNVSAKHDVSVGPIYNAALLAYVTAAKPDEGAKAGKHFVSIDNVAMVRKLNDLLRGADEPMTLVRLTEDSASLYGMDPASKEYLIKVLTPLAERANGG